MGAVGHTFLMAEAKRTVRSQSSSYSTGSGAGQQGERKHANTVRLV